MAKTEREMTVDVRGDALRIDGVMPEYDVEIAVHAIVDADTNRTFTAARELDFLKVGDPLMDASMWVRGAPATVAGWFGKGPPEQDVPAEMTLDALAGAEGGDWVFLAKDPPRELVFGAIGRFWTPTIEWKPVPAQEFRAFDEPGYGKIACAFTVLGYGQGRSLLTYLCRVQGTSDEARAGFKKYWTLVRPFVSHILRAANRQIKENAERGARPDVR
jgi:hypothetical protein